MPHVAADLDRLVEEQFGDRGGEPVSMPQLLERLRSADVVVLDTRPVNEYLAGHAAHTAGRPRDLSGALLGIALRRRAGLAGTSASAQSWQR